MCYAKPGPRCSAHTKEALAKAKVAYKEHPCDETKQALLEAKQDWNESPEGIKEAEAKAAAATDPAEKEKLERRARAFREARESKIEAFHRAEYEKDMALISPIDNALYDPELNSVKRYDENYSGFVFQGVDIQRSAALIELEYDEVLDSTSVYQLLDNGELTLEDLREPYNPSKIADDANWARSDNVIESLVATNEEDIDKVREIAGDGWEITYKVNRYITPRVVAEYYEQRRAELEAEEEEYEDED